MDPDAVAEFNDTKASTLRGLTPATVVFDHAPRHAVDVSLGLVTGEASLHPSGQGLTAERSAVLYFPIFTPVEGAANPSLFPPRASHAFTVTASRNAELVNTRWVCGSPITCAGEPTVKFTCTQLLR